MPHLSRPPTPKSLVMTTISLFLIMALYLVHVRDYPLPEVGHVLASATTGRANTPPPGAPKNPPIKVTNSAPEGIPEKIWYKLGPKGLTEQAHRWIVTCSDYNPRHRVELMTDESSDAADLLRYLILYAEGGMWSDLDVSCESVPIADWVAPEYRARADLVVGWEFDVGWGAIGQRQFASWTILARPGLPHMQQVIEDIVEAVQATAALHKVPVSGLDMTMVGDVVDFTGPRCFTRGILKSLQRTLGREVDVVAISEIRQPKLVENVLILPGFAFANSTNFFNPGESVGPILVTHHYAGSWKNDFGGEKADRRAMEMVA